MKCTKCATQNPDTANFCLNCGLPLELLTLKYEEKNLDDYRICSLCNKVNDSQACYCTECGARLYSGHRKSAQEKTGTTDSEYSETDWDDYRICPSCDSVNDGEAYYCKECGTGLYSGHKNPAQKKTETNSYNINFLIWKYICIIGGLLGTAIAVLTISNDTSGRSGYNYESPLTNHETMVLSLLAISLVAFFIGLLIPSKSKENQ